jgi:hypothetical protein
VADEHGDEFDGADEADEVLPVKGSWRILIVAGIVAAVILAAAAVVIGFELRDANRVVAETSADAGPARGADVRVVQSPCPRCSSSIAAVDGMSWADRLPQKVPLTVDKFGTSAVGELQLDGARVSVVALYGGTYLLSAECQLRADGDGPLTQAALDFLKGCVTAAIPDTEPDRLSTARAWLETRFRPADVRQPQVGLVCGQLVVDFLLDRRGADVVISGQKFPENEAVVATQLLEGCQER